MSARQTAKRNSPTLLGSATVETPALSPRKHAVNDLSAEALAKELGLATGYWLTTVQSHIALRKLRGAELFVATHAHDLLRRAAERAAEWNRTEDGRKAPISANQLPDWQDPRFRPPEPLFAAENLKPEVLAALAASLLPQVKNLTPVEAIPIAHDLLLAAERYVGALPKNSINDDWREHFDLAFSTVSFEEIQASNKDPRLLPLLPPLNTKRKAKTSEEITGVQTIEAIRVAVRRFLWGRMPLETKEDYQRGQEQEAMLKKTGLCFTFGGTEALCYEERQKLNQDAIAECLNNNRISLLDLSTMRWKRFQNQSLKQQKTAAKREQTKRVRSA